MEYMNQSKHTLSHNPYFSRWFSAIGHYNEQTNKLVDCHNPYFSRWFSAI